MAMWHPFGMSHRPHADPFFTAPFEVRATAGTDAIVVQGGCLMPHMTGMSDIHHMMTDAGVHVVDNAHMFGVQIDVSAYKPEEIDVKVRVCQFCV
jgi:hypothetical protein